MTDVFFLLNNFDEDGGARVLVADYKPPVEHGPNGRIAIEFSTVEEYDTVTRLLHESHGTAIRRQNQDDDYGFAVSDDGVPGAGFPQRVTFDLEWRYLVS